MLNRRPKYFKESEFKLGTPHPDLLTLLDELRSHIGKPIVITSSGRTVLDQIRIYEEKYGSRWLEKIPWGSKHLPSYESPYVRAVDFQVITSKGKDFTYYLGGKSIRDELLHVQKKFPDIGMAIGVGDEFVHLEVGDEPKPRIWYY